MDSIDRRCNSETDATTLARALTELAETKSYLARMLEQGHAAILQNEKLQAKNKELQAENEKLKAKLQEHSTS